MPAGWYLHYLGMILLLFYHHQAFTLLVTTITLIYFARPWVYVVNNEKKEKARPSFDVSGERVELPANGGPAPGR